MEESKTLEESLFDSLGVSQAIMEEGEDKQRLDEAKTYDAQVKNILAMREQEFQEQIKREELELKKEESIAKRELELKKHKQEVAQNWTKVGIGAAAVGFEAFLAYATLKFNLNLGNMVGDKNKGSVLRKIAQLGSIFKQ